MPETYRHNACRVSDSRTAPRRFKDSIGFVDLLEERDFTCNKCHLQCIEHKIGEHGQTYYTEYWNSPHSYWVCKFRQILIKRGKQTWIKKFAKWYLTKYDCMVSSAVVERV
mgnify:CR=1 FL=1